MVARLPIFKNDWMIELEYESGDKNELNSYDIESKCYWRKYGFNYKLFSCFHEMDVNFQYRFKIIYLLKSVKIHRSWWIHQIWSIKVEVDWKSLDLRFKKESLSRFGSTRSNYQFGSFIHPFWLEQTKILVIFIEVLCITKSISWANSNNFKLLGPVQNLLTF